MIFRLRSSLRLLRSTLFQPEFLRKHVPSLPRGRRKAAKLYLASPSLWGLPTHPLFDGAFYLKNNPDVAHAGVNPLWHYLTRGDREGRDPHPLFFVKHYKASGLEGNARTALEDYLLYGAKKGRTPFPDFDPSIYGDCVDQNLPYEQILTDLACNLQHPDRQTFLQRLSQRALQRCPRSAAVGSLEISEDPLTGPKSAEGLCDVVIPVKDAIDWLDRSVATLLACKEKALINSIVLVDDGCSSQSKIFLSEIAARDPQIQIVSNKRSRGFAAACNTGFCSTIATHVLFLNSDCLVNQDTISKMLAAFSQPQKVGLACAVANNAANATLPLLEGETFVSMNELLKDSSLKSAKLYPDICTTVGHCLMVSRECFVEVGGMDESWGLGYGEESDLHLRAQARGYLGVLVTDAYVYHFGGGTFRNENGRAELQRTNHARFISMWGDSYGMYSYLAEFSNPIPALEASLASKRSTKPQIKCDVLFVLPCIIHGIGGVHVVLDLCNHLIAKGLDCRIVVLGPLDRQALVDYPEPLYVNPIHAPSIDEWADSSSIAPGIVVSTLYSTVSPSWRLARRIGARLVNFIQGYEFFFDDGRPYEEVRDSYLLADYLLTTSTWLKEKAERKSGGMEARQLPLGVNRFIFHPKQSADLSGPTRLRVGIVFRASADKGQFVLRELADLIVERSADFSLTIFKPDDYPFTEPAGLTDDFQLVPLPASRTTIAAALREIDIFIDASLHEGYGLFPLEAMACGSCVVASDSGGVGQYLRDNKNGCLITAVNKPEAYLDKILELSSDRSKLHRLRTKGIETAAQYDESACFDRYSEFFAELLRRSKDSEHSDGVDLKRIA